MLLIRSIMNIITSLEAELAVSSNQNLMCLAVMKVEDFSSSEDEYSHAQFVPCALCRQACQRMRDSPLPHGKPYPIFCKKIQKTMLASTNRRSPVMTIPKEFCDRYFQFSQHGHVTFEDPIGRTWSIDTYKNSQGYFQFCSRGWDSFARSNNIKLYDFVLFKLVANCYLKVQVFSTGGLLKKN
ncbi:hypothetical protein O6H91_09G061900 [Diphasiastrum complanatum]|uniref:Uncharacterized protein n=1 Tax=Diphasiastrum complanatum TaxID=34168 RepID=A0ACC2CPU0_DIPCM|nr:hypothetical protein O6H91_09G061900 [Diphasiastrum complanatum]